MHKYNARNIIAAVVLILFATGAAADAQGSPDAGYLYNLSDFTGPLPYDSPRVVIDADRSEVYVLSGNSITVFNDAGMEIFRFGFRGEADRIVDVAVNKEGAIFLLVQSGGEFFLRRCNCRGVPQETIRFSGVPEDLAFFPNRMAYHGGLFYIADTNAMIIALTDEEGHFLNGYDVSTILELKEEERANRGMSGFGVDREGTMLFTIPVYFRAYRLALNEAVSSFGQAGSAPGRFNLVNGITRDSRGNYLVTDVIKSAVMVFDSSFNYLTQFGGPPGKPGELFAPRSVAVDASDRVYVSQSRNKGVSVFRLLY